MSELPRNRIHHLRAVGLLVAVGLAATSGAASAPATGSWLAADSPPAKQRVMLVEKHRFGVPRGTFVLHALSPGPLGFDSGSKLTLTAAERPYVVRDGQRLAVYIAVERFTGKRGSFDVRWRVEFAGAGEGSTVGTGAWSLVRGTGAYAGATGGGRLATVVLTPRGFTSAQFEGLLRAFPGEEHGRPAGKGENDAGQAT